MNVICKFESLNKMKKVLIVEDDKDFLWVLKEGFNNQEFSIIYAQDGQEGLEMAQREKPDLVIIDISLPKMDGIEMAKLMKESGVEAKMIFLTNLKDDEHISRAITISSDADYVIKSEMHVSDIVSRVKNKLGLA